MQLSDLLPNYYIENQEFDCKARLNRNDVMSWLKTVCGFANNRGGIFFLGVEDKTFKLVGYNQAEADNEKLYLHNEIANHMSIIPTYTIESIPYQIREETRFIIKVTFFESKKKPMIVRFDGMPMIFMRRDGFTNPATEEEIRLMAISSDRLSFDSAITDIDFNLDDFSTLSSFYFDRTGKELKIKELESIGFLSGGKLSNGGYLFSDAYDGKRSRVVCSLYRGENRGDDRIIASNAHSGNLIDCYRFIYEFIASRMNHGYIKQNDRRTEIDAYPSRALFEAIINALAHRDYLLEGTEIHVDMFVNRIVISSPGSLFESGGDLNPTYDLSSFVSKRRNEVISSTFVLAKAMEAKGTGLEKIMEDYAPYDKKHQPYIYCKNNAFHIVLPDLTNEEGVSLDQDSVVISGLIDNPTRFDHAVLSYCYLTMRSAKEIALHLHISNSSFFKKNVLDNLVAQSFLIEKKIGNAAHYLANPERIAFR